MNALETIDQPMSVALHEPPPPPPSLFGTNDPALVVQKAQAVADTLKGVIKRQGLISTIQGKEYPRCEAWTLLGTMLGVFPVLIWTRKLETGWEARVEARTRDGAVVGAAEAQCLNTERNWSNRDDFALRSMAQTRATAKCLRMPLGFVMTLGGLEATPAEEMSFERAEPPRTTIGTAKEPKNAPTPPKARPEATPDQRAKLVALFESEGRDAVQRAFGYFIDLGALLPTESLSDLALRWIPVTEREVRELAGLITISAAEGKSTRPSWVSGGPETGEARHAAPNEQDELMKGGRPTQSAPRAAVVEHQTVAEQPELVPSAPPSGARVLPEGMEEETGEIQHVTLKEGKTKAGKPWSLWGVKIAGQFHNTFDNTLGKAAMGNKGQEATVIYTQTERGRNIEDMIIGGFSVIRPKGAA